MVKSKVTSTFSHLLSIFTLFQEWFSLPIRYEDDKYDFIPDFDDLPYRY